MYLPPVRSTGYAADSDFSEVYIHLGNDLVGFKLPAHGCPHMLGCVRIKMTKIRFVIMKYMPIWVVEA